MSGRLQLRLLIMSVFLGILLKECKGGPEFITCARNFVKRGCFSTRRSKFNVLALSMRDPSSPLFRGPALWSELGRSLHDLACRCERESRLRGKEHFSLRFWGECWVATDDQGVPQQLRDQAQASFHCVEDRFSNCGIDEKLECVGKTDTEYVYALETTDSNAFSYKNGGWSLWSEWSPCSTSCGVGEKSRERTCTNPEPQGNGLSCQGEDVEAIQCSERECLVVLPDGGHNECEQQVKGLYLGLLLRTAEPTGFENNLKKCNELKDFRLLYGLFANSLERKELLCKNVIRGFYKHMLGRVPDSAGFQNWLSLCMKEANYASVLNGFIESAEFRQTRSPDACARRAVGLYLGILQRQPDAEGYTNNVKACAVGVKFEEQYSAIWNSKEKQILDCKFLVSDLFDYLWQRPPGLLEMQAYEQLCAEGRTEYQLLSDFVFSIEFKGKYKTYPPQVNSG